MFSGFREREIDVGDDIAIFTRVGGAGPPLLLLHGFPQTHVCWHKIADRLAKTFTVVATDLRGYGASSKPPGGGHHEAYSKRAMALDQLRVMRALGFASFGVAGHDRGGRVAHRMALDHPECVERLAVIDIAPTEMMYRKTDRAFAEAYYHWFFLIQPFDFPERLIHAQSHFYLSHTLESWSKTDGAISQEARDLYLAAFCNYDAIHAACEDYRAAATIDLEHDREDAAAGRRVRAPLLAVTGARGIVHRQFKVHAAWQDVSDAAVESVTLDCGHFVPEEAPDELLTRLVAFFQRLN